MNTRYTFLYLTAASLLLALTFDQVGCNVGPDYHKPEIAVPDSYAATQPTTQPGYMGSGAATQPSTQPASTQPAVPLGIWWQGFHDDTLNSLVTQALDSNHDLRIAIARIREARAALGITKGDAYPKIGGDLDYTRTHNSNYVPSQTIDSNYFNAGFDASWELDVFGGIRRNIQAAKADLQAVEANRRDIQVSLLAEVAQNYILVRTAQRRTRIAQNNIDTQTQFLSITKAKAKAGLTSDLDVAQAEALLAATKAEIPGFENSRQQGVHRLGVLLGKAPATLEDELKNPAAIPAGDASTVDIGVPADLLRRRPDIRNAERLLAASNARIGVATAELYPKFTITGLAGFQSVTFSDWFRPDAHAYQIGPSIHWRIFEGGKIREAINVANAQQEEARLTFEKSILTAMEDVENALVACQTEAQHRASLVEAVQANQRSLDLSGELYNKGLTNFLTVLDAQRSLFSYEDQLSQSESTMTLNLVALYKALGGGWELDQK